MVLTVCDKDGATFIRLSMGPEGEVLTDLAGCQDLDITNIVQELASRGNKIVLRCCRTRSEFDTVVDATELGLFTSYVMSLPNEGRIELEKAINDIIQSSQEPDEEAGNVDLLSTAKPIGIVHTEAAPTPAPAKQAKTQPKSELRWGHCQYCGEEEKLMPIPGFLICKKCAQIELGRLRSTTKPAPAKSVGDI